MLGRDRAAVAHGGAVNGVIDFMPLREKTILVTINRLADVEMDIAVTKMTERKRSRARNELRDRLARFRNEGRHGSDRHADVMLDRATLRLLRSGNGIAQVPERAAMCEALGDDGIVYNAGVHRFAKNGLQRFAQIR